MSTDSPSVGRPRSSAIDDTLFRTAFELVAAEGYRRLTIERVSAISGISKASIYRRFRSRADLAVEALLAIAPTISSNSPPGEKVVLAYLRRIFGEVRNRSGPMLRGLMGDAQLDPTFRDEFRERFIEVRRSAFSAALEAQYGHLSNLDLLLDFGLGLMWYRLLTDGETLNDQDAGDVAMCLDRLACAGASHPLRRS